MYSLGIPYYHLKQAMVLEASPTVSDLRLRPATMESLTLSLLKNPVLSISELWSRCILCTDIEHFGW
jgi:hypothetical protein